VYRVEYHPGANRVTISVRGFWTVEDIAPFAAAVGAKAQEARAIRDDFDVLIESLDFPVQANSVADLMTSVMRGGMALTSGRAAIVVASQLNKLQADRTLAHPRLKVFLSLADAEAWLAEQP
jgi:hypothetical protein